MKKVIGLLVIAFVGSFGIANAQIQKGNLMLGSDLGSGVAGTASNGLFGANFNLNKGSGWGVGVSPKIGYFIKDNIMIGGVVNLGYDKSADISTYDVNGNAITTSTKTTTYGIQALGRYYATDKQVDNLLKHGRFFVEANAGLAGQNISGGNTTNGFAFGFGPGYSYFVTQNVALEGLLKYNGLAGGGNKSYQNSIGLNFGVQVFLPSSKVRHLVKNPGEL